MYGIASGFVVFREVLYAGTVLISKLIARALTRGMTEPTVVYGTVSLPYGIGLSPRKRRISALVCS